MGFFHPVLGVVVGFSEVIEILGYSIKFQSSSEKLLSSVVSIYGRASESDVKTNININVELLLDKEKTSFYKDISFEISEKVLKGFSKYSCFIADRNSMSANAKICKNILEDEYLFRHQILNAMSYFLLSSQYITPLHCVSFSTKDKTFIFFGKSGAGKSSLAYSALQNGYSILSEDLAFICDEDEPVVRGFCKEVHLLEDCSKRFYSLKNSVLEQTHNNKLKYIIEIPNISYEQHQELIIFFIQANFSSKESVIKPVDDKKFFESLYYPKEEGFNMQTDSREKHIDWLTHNEAFVLEIGYDMKSLFSKLETL